MIMLWGENGARGSYITDSAEMQAEPIIVRESEKIRLQRASEVNKRRHGKIPTPGRVCRCPRKTRLYGAARFDHTISNAGTSMPT